MIRRLSDTDVREIFESLHSSRPTPSHLPFKIIPVGKNGLKLSPPSLEFEDGLYVLLQPAAKDCAPKVPSHLKHLVVKHNLPRETCPWSLSGPQFPQPTAIQQRYCYPKGSTDYSNKKGGALWTFFDKNGKEDVQYRLLHVYHSAKRSGNKSTTPSPARHHRPRESHWRPPYPPPHPLMMYPHPHPHGIPMIPHHHPRPMLAPPYPPGPYSAALTNSNSETDAYFYNSQARKRPRLQDSILVSPSRKEEEVSNITTAKELLAKPIHSFEEKPSFDLGNLQNDDFLFSALLTLDDPAAEEDCGADDKLAIRLEKMHKHLVEWIQTFDQTHQESMGKIVAEWALQLAKQPILADSNEDQVVTRTANV